MIDGSALARRLRASLRALLKDEEVLDLVYVAQAFGPASGETTFLGVFLCQDIARSCAKRAVAQFDDLKGADVLVLPVSVIEQAWAYNPHVYLD